MKYYQSGPKNLDILTSLRTYPEFEQNYVTFLLCVKTIIGKIANSADPDQTAPFRSSLI